MKTICYIIPYFGKLPKNFALYLLGCAQNPTIDWKILTDDRTFEEGKNLTESVNDALRAGLTKYL